MNAPARIQREQCASSPPASLREARGEKLARAYRATISMHCPNQDEMTMAARLELAVLRDQASKGIAHASHSAAILLMQVSSLAAEAVYAPLTFRKLSSLVTALNLTMLAARSIERCHRD
ncbi:hypothetical protein [Sphingomonas sp.]|uniref:hypothetical protein n=1 Tax=Sphingomonas sp. TaxID=28214 RepID=UPI0035C7E737